jgi:hypothetical protein
MDIARIVAEVLADLALVATSEPNERLPKEEQIRCRIYSSIRQLFRVVCAERGYGSIDEKHRTECDLWASSPGRAPVWLEFKRCWSASGWINKPPEQLGTWRADVDKLRKVPVSSDRYFMLIGFFDFDLQDERAASHCGVVQNIRRFHTRQLVHQTSQEFAWRPKDGITHVGVWAWYWPLETAVELF